MPSVLDYKNQKLHLSVIKRHKRLKSCGFGMIKQVGTSNQGQHNQEQRKLHKLTHRENAPDQGFLGIV